MPRKCVLNNVWLLYNKDIHDSRETQTLAAQIIGCASKRLTSCLPCERLKDNQKAGQQSVSISTYFMPAVDGPNDVTTSTCKASVRIAGRQLQPMLYHCMAMWNDLLSIEVMWELKTMDAHYWYSLCANTGELSFPIEFSVGESKCVYLSTVGIALYLKTLENGVKYYGKVFKIHW